MRFLKISPSSLGLATACVTMALTALPGCGGQTDVTDTAVQSALSSSTDTAAASVDLAGCLTAYVTCRRADGSDIEACHQELRSCLRPPRPEGDGGACDHHKGGGEGDGDRPPPGDGDHDGPPPPPPGGDGSAPPPPPPDDEGGHDGPPPPPPGADGGAGPRVCFDALETCASGTDEAATCVDAAVTCLAAFPPPPRPRRH